MYTLKLKVGDGVYEKLLLLLSKFNKDEIEIITESSEFASNQQYLSAELNEIYNEKASFIEMTEAEERIENIIKKHESSI